MAEIPSHWKKGLMRFNFEADSSSVGTELSCSANTRLWVEKEFGGWTQVHLQSDPRIFGFVPTSYVKLLPPEQEVKSPPIPPVSTTARPPASSFRPRGGGAQGPTRVRGRARGRARGGRGRAVMMVRGGGRGIRGGRGMRGRGRGIRGMRARGRGQFRGGVRGGRVRGRGRGRGIGVMMMRGRGRGGRGEQQQQQQQQRIRLPGLVPTSVAATSSPPSSLEMDAAPPPAVSSAFPPLPTPPPAPSPTTATATPDDSDTIDPTASAGLAYADPSSPALPIPIPKRSRSDIPDGGGSGTSFGTSLVKKAALTHQFIHARSRTKAGRGGGGGGGGGGIQRALPRTPDEMMGSARPAAVVKVGRTGGDSVRSSERLPSVLSESDADVAIRELAKVSRLLRGRFDFVLQSDKRWLIDREKVKLLCIKKDIVKYTKYTCYLFSDLVVFVDPVSATLLNYLVGSNSHAVHASLIDLVGSDERDPTILHLNAYAADMEVQYSLQFPYSTTREEWDQAVRQCVLMAKEAVRERSAIPANCEDLSELARLRHVEFDVCQGLMRKLEPMETKYARLEKTYLQTLKNIENQEKRLGNVGMQFAMLQVKKHETKTAQERFEDQMKAVHADLADHLRVDAIGDKRLLSILTFEAGLFREIFGHRPVDIGQIPSLPELGERRHRRQVIMMVDVNSGNDGATPPLPPAPGRIPDPVPLELQDEMEGERVMEQEGEFGDPFLSESLPEG